MNGGRFASQDDDADNIDHNAIKINFENLIILVTTKQCLMLSKDWINLPSQQHPLRPRWLVIVQQWLPADAKRNQYLWFSNETELNLKHKDGKKK